MITIVLNLYIKTLMQACRSGYRAGQRTEVGGAPTVSFPYIKDDSEARIQS